MQTYKFHPWTIRSTLKNSAISFIQRALPLALFFAGLGLVLRNPGLQYVALAFIPGICIVLVVFLGLEWLDFRFTCFHLSDTEIDRWQYGRITRRISRDTVIDIKRMDNGVKIYTRRASLLVPDGLVGEDGSTGDIHARLLSWIPEERA